MRRLIYLMLVCVLVISITGCGKEPTVEGVWEEEITVSVLGITDQPGTQAAILRYTFSEDGTGIMEIIPDQHPETTEAFTYAVEGDNLLLTFTSTTQGAVPFAYTIKSLTKDSLAISLYGVTNNLTRVK